jgi:type I restriction enzyme S subunit
MTPGHFHEAGGFKDVGEKQKLYDGPVSERYLLSKGDLIVAMTEQADGLLGSAALVPVGGLYLHNQRLGKVTTLSRDVSLGFLYRVFNSPTYRVKVRETAAGTKVKHTSPSKLLAIPVAIPPTKAEQEAIAGALSDADALIESLEQLLAKKRHLKQGAMQELLTGKKRLPGFVRDWRSVPAGTVGAFRGGSGFPTATQGNASGRYPFFKVSDMNNPGNEIFMATANNYIDDGIRRQVGAVAFPAGSIVFAKVGAAVFLERKRLLVKASCLDNNMAALILDENQADSRFILYLLLSMRLSDLVSTTALPSLNRSVLSSMQFFLPPLAEQVEIAALLSDVDSELAALEAKLTKARQIKQGMMQELLTGRIRLV